ncbi:MAG: glycosyl transferase [Chitinophagales bacterium]|nr:glycosyl transferase [Chitinophagales bacterium]
MKILYAIQSTGNGHLSRATEILPHLLDYGDVDILISGSRNNLDLPFLVKFRKRGLNFQNGKRGGINYLQTILQCRPFRFLKDVLHFPVEQYDLVLNDFEPVTAWACRLKHKACVGMSHQASFVSAKTPRPAIRRFADEMLLSHFAPAHEYTGFHFSRYDHFIHLPVIRKRIREAENIHGNHYTVYLPSYADRFLIKRLNKLDEVLWEVFSKDCRYPERFKNVVLFPITSERFSKSLTSCSGVLCGAGFETPAEALFLKKKLMAIPMKGQYEQACNSAALQQMGIKTLTALDNDFHLELLNWMETPAITSVCYPDATAKIVESIITKHKSRQYDEAIMQSGQLTIETELLQ